MAQKINLLRYVVEKPTPIGWTKKIKRNKAGKVTSVTLRRSR